jgi:hypothetical protein
VPLLAAWLTSLFSGLTVFFAGWLTKRAAFIAAGIASFAALVASLYATMAALVAGAGAVFPSGGLLATGVWLFIPDNTITCLSIMIAADTALSLFFWQQVNLNIALRGAN